MKKNLLLTVVFIMAVLLLSGCFDATKSLIIFDNIGMKRNTLGIYHKKKNDEDKLVSLCYKNSKYYARYTFSSNSVFGFLQGNFE